MAEPTTSTALAAATATGVGIIAMLPWLDVNALIGSISGAAVVAIHRSDVSPLTRLMGMIVAVLVGYVCAPEIVNHTFMTQTGPAAVLGAVLIVPLLLRVLLYVERLDIAAWIKSRWGG